MRKTKMPGLAGFFLTLIVAFSFAVFGRENLSSGKISLSSSRKADYNDILVTRVVDGDTLKLGNGQRVRMIGIDTPEMHDSNKLYRDIQKSGQEAGQIKKMGKKSYEYARDLVEGKKVRLEFDVEKKDRYGRLLAYVYLPDGTFVNAEIVRQGFASLMTIPPNVKYADTFLKLYQEARENNRGLWK